MHKKWLWLLAAACLAILALTGALAEEENLLENPDFELLDEDGLPAGWYTEAYRQDGRTVFSAGDSALSGLHSAAIRSFDVNDARFCQDVPVQPETVSRAGSRRRAFPPARATSGAPTSRSRGWRTPGPRPSSTRTANGSTWSSTARPARIRTP